MGGGTDLRHLTQQFHIGRRVVEVVVADQASVGFAADLVIFLAIQLLENRGLIPGRAFELANGFVQVLLGNVEHPDLQHLVGFGVVHQEVQAAPCAFELLILVVVNYLVHLLGHLPVDLGDHRFERQENVVGDQAGILQRLLRQRRYRRLHRGFGVLGPRFEFLLE